MNKIFLKFLTIIFLISQSIQLKATDQISQDADQTKKITAIALGSTALAAIISYAIYYVFSAKPRKDFLNSAFGEGSPLKKFEKHKQLTEKIYNLAYNNMSAEDIRLLKTKGSGYQDRLAKIFNNISQGLEKDPEIKNLLQPQDISRAFFSVANTINMSNEEINTFIENQLSEKGINENFKQQVINRMKWQKNINPENNPLTELEFENIPQARFRRSMGSFSDITRPYLDVKPKTSSSGVSPIKPKASVVVNHPFEPELLVR